MRHCQICHEDMLEEHYSQHIAFNHRLQVNRALEAIDKSKYTPGFTVKRLVKQKCPECGFEFYDPCCPSTLKVVVDHIERHMMELNPEELLVDSCRNCHIKGANCGKH